MEMLLQKGKGGPFETELSALHIMAFNRQSHGQAIQAFVKNYLAG
jgi:hypothetical protein